MHGLFNTKRVPPKGHTTLTRKGAAHFHSKGIPITVAGNNVNSYHIFGGWYLGYTIDPGKPFDECVRNFMFYLERELGTYPVFYAPEEEIIRWMRGTDRTLKE